MKTLILLFLLIFITGCAPNADDPVITQQYSPEVTQPAETPAVPEAPEVPEAPTENIPAEPFTVTKLQLSEDFGELLEILDNNYPHFNTARRIFGSDREEITARYREKLEQFPESVPLLDAAHFIWDFIAEFGGTGHFQFFNNAYYSLFQSVFPEFIMNFDNSQTVIETYEYLAQNELRDPERPQRLNPIYETPTVVEDLIEINENLSYKIIDDDTVYLNINSFLSEHYINDREPLDEFFTRFDGYENLIIDITKNGGGTDEYWSYNIVAPNITENMWAPVYGLGKSTGIHGSSFETNKQSASYNTIGSLPNMTREILDEFDTAYESWHSVEPRGDTKLFNGNIYILTGRTTGSAADGLAMFSKNTGFATLVGTNTGGDGGYLRIEMFSLPNTGFIFRFSTLFALNNDGTSNTEFGTIPDYFAPEGVSALEACLKLLENT